MSDKPFVITISHQLGAGGAYMGNKLSKRLGIPFIDRDVLKQVADQLQLSETDLEKRDERLSSFWESFTRMARYSDPQALLTTNPYIITDQELFQLESEYIQRIAEKTSESWAAAVGTFCAITCIISVLWFTPICLPVSAVFVTCSPYPRPLQKG